MMHTLWNSAGICNNVLSQVLAVWRDSKRGAELMVTPASSCHVLPNVTTCNMNTVNTVQSRCRKEKH